MARVGRIALDPVSSTGHVSFNYRINLKPWARCRRCGSLRAMGRRVEHVLVRAGDPGAPGDRRDDGRCAADLHSASMRPRNSESMIERAMKRSPSFISPFGMEHGHVRRTAVPVGERSILPGCTATAWRPVSVVLAASGPRTGRTRYATSPGFSGWLKPSCSLAALVIAMPVSERSLASSAVSAKPSVFAIDHGEGVAAIGGVHGQCAQPSTSSARTSWPAKEGTLCTVMRSALPSAAFSDDLDQAAGRLQRESGFQAPPWQ